MEHMRSQEGGGGFFVHAFSRLKVKDEKDGVGGVETMIAILYYLINQTSEKEKS